MENENNFNKYGKNDKLNFSIVYYPNFKKFVEKKVIVFAQWEKINFKKRKRKIFGKNIMESNIEDI